jgi:hypothetical protein
MTELEKVLIERDAMTREEAKQLILDAYLDMNNYTSIDDFMADWFGLEPDYICDLIEVVAAIKVEKDLA